MKLLSGVVGSRLLCLNNAAGIAWLLVKIDIIAFRVDGVKEILKAVRIYANLHV